MFSKNYSKVSGDSSFAHTTGTTEFESAWRKRKPTHLPSLVGPSSSPSAVLDCSPLTTIHHCGSVLSIAPSIISNAPSTASGSSTSSDAPFDPLAKLELLRRKLGEEVPASAAFHAVPRTPRTAVPTSTSTLASKRSPRGRTRSPHPSRYREKHVYQAGPLPPIPPMPASAAAASSSRSRDDESVGLVRPRQKMAAGSRFGGADFKAARRAKREGRALDGMTGLGELVEMVGFLW